MPKNKYFPFGFWNSPTAVVPPPPKLSDGSDGDLVVLNGQTVQITAGNIYSYNSIDIQAGGVLEIVGIENAVTQVACRNSFICNGTFRGKYTEVAVGNIVLPSDNWLGLSFSHSQSQSSGGWGGCAWSAANNMGKYSASGGNMKFEDSTFTYIPAYGQQGWGGDQYQGHGGAGGGNGANDYSWNEYWIGGSAGTVFDAVSPNVYTVPYLRGLTGSLNGFNGSCNQTEPSGQNYLDGGCFGGSGGGSGHGGIVYAYAGGTATFPQDYSTLRNIFKGGSGATGGGGGYISNFKGAFGLGGWSGAAGGGRGEHGRRVFILAEDGISGSGTIDFAGNNGYNATQTYTMYSGNNPGSVAQLGGGGGGGAGGSGGAVWIRHRATTTVNPTILSSGGSGGLRSRFSSLLPPGESLFGFSWGIGNNGTGTNKIGIIPRDGNGGSSGIIDVQSY